MPLEYCNCGEELSPNAQHEDCPKCRASHRYWDKKRPSERLKRREKLGVWSGRMMSWFDRDGKPK
jgi:hypothetical protein